MHKKLIGVEHFLHIERKPKYLKGCPTFPADAGTVSSVATSNKSPLACGIHTLGLASFTDYGYQIPEHGNRSSFWVSSTSPPQLATVRSFVPPPGCSNETSQFPVRHRPLASAKNVKIKIVLLQI